MNIDEGDNAGRATHFCHVRYDDSVGMQQIRILSVEMLFPKVEKLALGGHGARTLPT